MNPRAGPRGFLKAKVPGAPRGGGKGLRCCLRGEEGEEWRREGGREERDCPSARGGHCLFPSPKGGGGGASRPPPPPFRSARDSGILESGGVMSLGREAAAALLLLPPLPPPLFPLEKEAEGQRKRLGRGAAVARRARAWGGRMPPRGARLGAAAAVGKRTTAGSSARRGQTGEAEEATLRRRPEMHSPLPPFQRPC